MVKKIRSCPPLEIKPTMALLPDVPPYPDGEATTQRVTLDNANDPDQYRCAFADEFDGDLSKGRWKHYLTDGDDLEACKAYSNLLTWQTDWRVTYEGCYSTLKALLAKKRDRVLLVLLLPGEEKTSVLVGRKIQKR